MKHLALLVFCLGSIVCYAYNRETPMDTTRRSFIEKAYMDPTVKPGDNFFLYVNGTWIKNAQIPPTEYGAGAAFDLLRQTKQHLKSIIESVSQNQQPAGSIAQKVGDFYASGMDSVRIEKLGFDPVKPWLRKIEAFNSAKSVLDFEAAIQQDGYSYIIAMPIFADQKNSSMNVANLLQTGLGLPDRDYYFKTDPSTVQVQDAYKTYIRKIFRLTGDDSIAAEKKCIAVYELEKQMASSHRTNVELRDPQSNYRKVAVKELDQQMPAFGWPAFFHAAGANTDSLNIAQSGYYSKLNELLKSTSIETWKAYYRFHLVDDAANALSSAFVEAKFNYSDKALSGQQKIKPRWERIYKATDSYLGDPLGELYVQKYFSENAKKRMYELVNNLQTAFATRISNLDWMSDSTKQIAKAKLFAFLKKVGYPDKWRDYSKVNINRNTYFENTVACSRNQQQYQLEKLGKPVDKTEWGMTAPTINAYYNPTFNEIVFPAGILQFPFFDEQADDAINYGAIGVIIGHEMTHGFDDQGAQYDKDGNLKNWWAKDDNEKFVKKSKQVIDLYNGFTVLDTVHINGALTTGENMADIGGVAIAYDAFKLTKEGQDTAKIDGFTPDQRFFISNAQITRIKQKDQVVRQRINVDPHSPFMYRVIGPLENFTPFYNAFHLQPTDKMYRPESERIKIW